MSLDLTAYTETHSGSDYYAVTAPKVVATSLPRGVKSLLYKDYGVDNFTDFTHSWRTKVTSRSDAGQCMNYMLANTVNDYISIHNASGNALGIIWVFPAGTQTMSLAETTGGAFNSDASVSLGLNTDYYPKLVRDVGGTETDLFIYDDVGQLSLVDALSITETSGVDYSHHYAISSRNDGAGSPISLEDGDFDFGVISVVATLHASTSIYDDNFSAFKVVGNKNTIV